MRTRARNTAITSILRDFDDQDIVLSGETYYLKEDRQALRRRLGQRPPRSGSRVKVRTTTQGNATLARLLPCFPLAFRIRFCQIFRRHVPFNVMREHRTESKRDVDLFVYQWRSRAPRSRDF